MSLEGKFGHPEIWSNHSGDPHTSHHDLRGVYVDDNLNKVEKDISITFKGLSHICSELSEEGFEEVAPQMYAIYKEMKKIDSYRKMAEILEDN